MNGTPIDRLKEAASRGDAVAADELLRWFDRRDDGEGWHNHCRLANKHPCSNPVLKRQYRPGSVTARLPFSHYLYKYAVAVEKLHHFEGTYKDLQGLLADLGVVAISEGLPFSDIMPGNAVKQWLPEFDFKWHTDGTIITIYPWDGN